MQAVNCQRSAVGQKGDPERWPQKGARAQRLRIESAARLWARWRLLRSPNPLCIFADKVRTVQYQDTSRQIWCACHNGTYDMTGRVVSGPPPKPLEEYAVLVRGEDVVISRRACNATGSDIANGCHKPQRSKSLRGKQLSDI